MMSSFETNLGYEYKNSELLVIALTHRSYYHEKKRVVTGHNEKFEFLGDAVLDLALSEILLQNFPQDGEGSLSKKRASLVNEEVLSQVASELKIHEFLLLGKGEFQTGGLSKPRLLASAYEAVLGSIFLDAGYEKVRELVQIHFMNILKQMELSNDFERDYKTRLQELTQKKVKVAPTYILDSEEGPAHDKIFTISLMLQDRLVSQASVKVKNKPNKKRLGKRLRF